MSGHYAHRRASWRLCTVHAGGRRARLVYRGAVYPAYTRDPEWQCDHEHPTYRSAHACAEAELDRRTRGDASDQRHHEAKITNPATGEKVLAVSP